MFINRGGISSTFFCGEIFSAFLRKMATPAILIVAVAVVFLGCFLVGCSSGNGKTENTKISANNKDDGRVDSSERAESIGRPVRCGINLEMTVHKAEEYEDPTWELAQGHYLMAIDISFRNVGTEKEEIVYGNLEVRDSNGERYQVEVGKEPWLPDKAISPGEEIRGYVTVELPRSAKDLKLVFESFSTSGKDVTIKI